MHFVQGTYEKSVMLLQLYYFPFPTKKKKGFKKPHTCPTSISTQSSVPHI